MRIRPFLILITLLAGCMASHAAPADDSETRLKQQLDNFFLHYRPNGGVSLPASPRVESYQIDDLKRKLTVRVNATFAMQTFTPAQVKSIYKKLGKTLPRPFNKYQIDIVCCGMPLALLVDTHPDMEGVKPGQWGKINYDARPWVDNVSRPNDITHGLYNRHLSVWASHGTYFDNRKQRWVWQRPNLFGTTEDLFTQTIVVPYLIPMLQNAGAVVFTPRERDWQRHEVIVDNDKPASGYSEQETWRKAPLKGFAAHGGKYSDGENPFAAGTARMMATTTRRKATAWATYQPDIPEEGRYAVYVSYQTVEGSVDDAEYTVYHQGQSTTFRVNQQMGGGTWVYLGTFCFDRGSNVYNKVVVSNQSGKRGIVTTDAVRFGGGMGNILRGGTTSGMPRCLEGARYWAQWAGAPVSVYGAKEGADDYADDINTRSMMTNWLAGGSTYVPALEGKGVPIEMSLAVHSDAGYDAIDNNGLIGTLAVCTTRFNDGSLNCGVSRMLSHDLADSLLTSVCRDLRLAYGRWPRRYLWDRNYSETRCPEVPSAILEMLSHQNFPDMMMGQDPNFKFTMARAIYKAVLRFVNAQHGQPCIVQPLPPGHFCVSMNHEGTLTLAWTATDDPQEPTATPTAYKVYVAEGTADFDNGTLTNSTRFSLKAKPGIKYNFRVAAVNRGGESFPTETLTAVYHSEAARTVCIVNGFHRLSAPAVVNDDFRQGFDLNTDIGVQRDVYAGWNGQQLCFDKSQMGKEGPGGLGFGGDELAGKFIAGNTFNFVSEHADAMASNAYNIVSCSSKALEAGIATLDGVACIDLILGLECDDGHSLVHYKALPTSLRKKIDTFLASGGRLLVSGAYIGTDMESDDEKQWLARQLKVSHVETDSIPTGDVNGLGLSFNLYRTPCSEHYATQQPDVLAPQASAFCAMQYTDGASAAVAYDGADYKCFTMGFPLECIQNKKVFSKVMDGILQFLMK